ncbi:TolC family protein [Bosea sp. (in: a-proteobacteria)]|uniref:TolC family protein n=1 Tax=Bosea sp. (in: a-proteobacteria) TaxID=1871050 RepID=UPI0026157946|nr:TolC family protein [Bosea sp. (in: a-proteobacteria)]MCO5090809.1 TolC family protein [Bosea sp. (in: a-proteobacteria)]
MRPILACVLICLGLMACTIQPEPFTQAENEARAAADLAAIDVNGLPPNRPITLAEAQARAISYNLDTRLQMFNSALQREQLDLTKLDMLPNLTANAGYAGRDKSLVSSSASYRNGIVQPSNFETTSVDRERRFADLTLSWNVIDFGLSYLQAKQQADRVNIAEEQRRRVVANVFQQVRNAYWSAVAADRMRPELRRVMAEARRAQAASRQMEAEREQKPEQALRYQRDLLELIQELESVDDQLAIARVQLAQLMGLRPGTPFRLAVPATPPRLGNLGLSLDQMERVALVNRSELREDGYNARIVQTEGHRALLRLVPGVTLLGSLNYDSNSYLLYNNWQEGGVRIAANLIRIVTNYPKIAALNEVQSEISETRRLATTMAVLAQVQVSAQQYQIARKNYERLGSISLINRRIAQLSHDGQEAQTTPELDAIREKAAAALTELRRQRAYADLQNAHAGILVSLGLDPVPAEAYGQDLGALTAEISRRNEEWRTGRVAIPRLDETPRPATTKVAANTP